MKCKICGCTDMDCRGCIERTGGPCSWVAPEICSACEDMLALSLKQPYAGLMIHGKEETRNRNTNYRGWVLICASKVSYRIDEVINISGQDQFDRIIGLSEKLNGIEGYAIAIGYLKDCIPMTAGKANEDKTFVKYQPGKYKWIFENVRAIQPIPWKGSQGWKKVSLETIQQIRFI